MGLTVPPGRTHMFYTGTPEFAFGAGLSYTEWGMAWNSSQSHAQGDELVFSLAEEAALKATAGYKGKPLQVQLSNTGGLAGRQTLLMFWRPVDVADAGTSGGSKALKLRQKLLAYRGTGDLVKPGATKSLVFDVAVDALAMVPEGATDGTKVVALGRYELVVSDGNTAAGAKTLTRTLRVVA